MAFTEILKSYNKKTFENSEVFKSLNQKLTEEKWFKPWLDYSEQLFKCNRVYIVTGFGSLMLTTLLYHFGIQLIIGAVGFLYPGYQTIKCLESFEVCEARKWLTYWLVFSAFNFLEILLFFLHWIPAYCFLKCVFYTWCFASFQMNGSYVIYNLLIRPLFEKNQSAIDVALDRIKKTMCIDANVRDGSISPIDESLMSCPVVEKSHVS